jgi:ABC-type lipoprotein release transport system permease subunit
MCAFLLDLRIAALNLLEHKRRTLLLSAAIATVTALLVLLNGLSAGIHHTLVETATTLSSGDLNVGGFYKVTSSRAGPIVTDYPHLLEVVKRDVPELEFAVARGRGWGKIISDSGSVQAGIAGIDIAAERDFGKVVHLASGNLADLQQPNTMLLFESQVKKLQVKVGDAVTISAQTPRGVANTVDCRIVAIAKDVGLLSQWSIFTSADTLRDLYQLRPDVTGAIQLHVNARAKKDLPRLAARLRVSLEKAGYRLMEPDPRPFFMKFQNVAREQWTGQKLDVTTWEDELSFMMWTLKALDGLTFILMLILMAIVVMGIMNTLWIAIRERTKEIGALRAMGMQRPSVVRMFFLESLVLGLVGGCAGIVLGLCLAALINSAHIHVPLSVQVFLMSDTLNLAMLPASLLGALALVASVTAVASLFPSLRAAQLRPVDAMSHF